MKTKSRALHESALMQVTCEEFTGSFPTGADGGFDATGRSRMNASSCRQGHAQRDRRRRHHRGVAGDDDRVTTSNGGGDCYGAWDEQGDVWSAAPGSWTAEDSCTYP